MIDVKIIGFDPKGKIKLSAIIEDVDSSSDEGFDDAAEESEDSEPRRSHPKHERSKPRRDRGESHGEKSERTSEKSDRNSEKKYKVKGRDRGDFEKRRDGAKSEGRQKRFF